MDWCSAYNPLPVRKASRSKKQARDMFEKLWVPHATGTTFFSPYTAYRFVKEHWFPVCIKPNVGGYSRGSYFPITTWKEFWYAALWVKIWWPNSIIEEYLLGKNYRVVVTKWEVNSAIERMPSFVIGDGEKTISTLIDEENKIRRDMELTPVIHEIEKKWVVKAHLKKHGKNFSSIPKKWEKVQLFHRVALAPGGVLETIDLKTISKKNTELFLKILDWFDANIFGIDVIMEKGIETDYDKQKTIFLELNSRPYLKMHHVPRYGKPHNLKPMYDKLNALNIDNTDIF